MNFLFIYRDRAQRFTFFTLPDRGTFVGVFDYEETGFFKKQKTFLAVTLFVPLLFAFIIDQWYINWWYREPFWFLTGAFLALFFGELIYRKVYQDTDDFVKMLPAGTGYYEEDLPYLLQMGERQISTQRAILIGIGVVAWFCFWAGAYLEVDVLVLIGYVYGRLGKFGERERFARMMKHQGY